MKHFKIKNHQNGIVQVIFDMAETRANIFNEETLTELSQVCDDLATLPDAKCFVFTSGKNGIFIAGADVNLIKKLKSKDEGREASRAGQAIFQKVADLKVPTIVAIRGACMGGGTEFSLACTYRVVSDSSKTKIALPEVNLGILPGWGGTQRLPRLIGFVRSLDYILSGKSMDARSAVKLSFANDQFPDLIFEEKVMEFAHKVIQNKVTPATPVLSATERAIEFTRLTRKIALSKARETVMKKTRGAYPAPLKILDVLDTSFGCTLSRGLEIEAEGFGELAGTPISLNLIEIFLGSEEKKKVSPKNAKPISKGAVLGAGVMGGGVAWAYAEAKIPSLMKDITPAALASGMQSAQKVFAGKLKRKAKGTEFERQLLLNMGLIHPQLDYSGFKTVDVVIEAIVENLDIKRKVITECFEQVNDQCIIASNTSSLLISDIQRGLKNASRIVGMHFFNPVHKMPLVEVIAGKETDKSGVDTIVALAQKMGKVPIVVNDGPGFLVNRLLLPYMNEALWLLHEGVRVEDIERACLNFGLPMGPIHLTDEVGIDVAFKVAKILHDSLGDRLPPCPIGEKVLATGALGSKNKKGFYLYDGRGKKLELNPEVMVNVPNNKSMDEAEIIARVIYPLIREAQLTLEEGIVANAQDLDLAMVFGTGFAPFRGGPAKYADSITCARVADKLGELTHKVSPRFKPTPGLDKFKFYK